MSNLKTGDKVVVKYTEIINKIMVVSKGKFIEVEILQINNIFCDEITVRYPGFIKYIPKTDIVYKVNKPKEELNQMMVNND